MGDENGGEKPAMQPGTETSSGADNTGGRLVRRAPRTARTLDPQGIYDTRSMARRRLAKRRRTFSSLLVLGVAVVVGSTFIVRGREPRVSSWEPIRIVETDLDIAALVAPDASNARAVAVARDGRLTQLEAKGQMQMWRASDFSLRVPPLLALGRIVVGGEDGVLRAFDAVSRRRLWQSAGESAISTRAVLFDPASTWDASKSIAARAEAAVVVGDDAGLVRAVRLRDGKLLWKTSIGAPCGNGLSVSRVNGGRVLIFVPLLSGAARRGGVAALDARSGRIAWRYPSDERLFAAMLVPPLVRSLDGKMRLFCADDAGVISALDAATGRSSTSTKTRGAGLWKAFLAPLPSSLPSSAAGSRFFWQRWFRPSAPKTSSQESANTNTFDNPGEENVTPRIGQQANPAQESAAPLLVSARAEMLWIATPRGPLLVVAGNDGGVRALEARSGRLLWSGDAGDVPIAMLQAPRAGGGASIVIVTPHAVERRDAQDGRRLSRTTWSPEMGLAQAAASTRTHLFVAARDIMIFDWALAPE